METKQKNMNSKTEDEEISLTSMPNDDEIKSLLQVVYHEDTTNISDESLTLKTLHSNNTNETAENFTLIDNKVKLKQRKSIDDQKQEENSDFYEKLNKREPESFTTSSVYSGKSTLEPHLIERSEHSLTSDKATSSYNSENESNQVIEQQAKSFTNLRFYDKSTAESESKIINEDLMSNKKLQKFSSDSVSDQGSSELPVILSHCTLYNRKMPNIKTNERNSKSIKENESLLFQSKKVNKEISDFSSFLSSFNSKHRLGVHPAATMSEIESVSRVRSRLEKAGVYNKKFLDEYPDDALISHFSNLPKRV